MTTTTIDKRLGAIEGLVNQPDKWHDCSVEFLLDIGQYIVNRAYTNSNTSELGDCLNLIFHILKEKRRTNEQAETGDTK